MATRYQQRRLKKLSKLLLNQSSQVFVGVGLLHVTLQVFPADKILNPPLDNFDVRLQQRQLNTH